MWEGEEATAKNWLKFKIYAKASPLLENKDPPLAACGFLKASEPHTVAPDPLISALPWAPGYCCPTAAEFRALAHAWVPAEQEHGAPKE